MLKNIVFDLGGVVVAHNEEGFREKLGKFFDFVFGPDMKCVPSFWCDLMQIRIVFIENKGK